MRNPFRGMLGAVCGQSLRDEQLAMDYCSDEILNINRLCQRDLAKKDKSIEILHKHVRVLIDCINEGDLSTIQDCVRKGAKPID